MRISRSQIFSPSIPSFFLLTFKRLNSQIQVTQAKLLSSYPLSKCAAVVASISLVPNCVPCRRMVSIGPTPCRLPHLTPLINWAAGYQLREFIFLSFYAFTRYPWMITIKKSILRLIFPIFPRSPILENDWY